LCAVRFAQDYKEAKDDGAGIECLGHIFSKENVEDEKAENISGRFVSSDDQTQTIYFGNISKFVWRQLIVSSQSDQHEGPIRFQYS
jgi:hypothetical protein